VGSTLSSDSSPCDVHKCYRTWSWAAKQAQVESEPHVCPDLVVEKKKMIRQRHSQEEEEEEEEEEENSGEVLNILKCFPEVDIKKESEEKERVWSACHGLVLLPNKKLLASLVAGDLISPALFPAPVLFPKL